MGEMEFAARTLYRVWMGQRESCTMLLDRHVAIPTGECLMRIVELNHVAIHVADVDASVGFYRDTMKFPVMDRPAFDFPGAWFRLGADQELHLIGDRTTPVQSHHRGGHFALQVDSLDQWESHLDACGATRLARRTRPDGASQTFVQDPDGHWIELFTPPSGS